MKNNNIKPAFEMKHVKGVKAWGLLFEGKEAGKIVANFSDNPNGSVCTCTASIWTGPLAELPKSTAKAQGYGYCKFDSCLEKLFFKHVDHFVGISDGRFFLESFGYTVLEVI